MKGSLRSGTCSLLERPGLPLPAPCTDTPVHAQSPQTSAAVGSHLVEHGYHGNSWAVQLGSLSPRLVPLDSRTQASPAQPCPAWGAAKAAGLRWAPAAPSSEPTLCCREILRGSELSGLYGLFSASTGLLLPCQQRLGPAVSPLPRTLWILAALKLGRPSLVFGELFPAAAPTPHHFLLRPASSNRRLSKTPLHPPGWVWVRGVSVHGEEASTEIKGLGLKP